MLEIEEMVISAYIGLIGLGPASRPCIPTGYEPGLVQTAWVVAPYSVTTTSSLPPCLSSSSSPSIGTSYAIRSIDATSAAERQSLYAIEPIRTPWIFVFDEGKR